jgi:hypothetical protein
MAKLEMKVVRTSIDMAEMFLNEPFEVELT